MKDAVFLSYIDKDTTPTFHCIQTVAFYLRDLRKRCGEEIQSSFFWGLNSVNHESGYFGLWVDYSSSDHHVLGDRVTAWFQQPSLYL